MKKILIIDDDKALLFWLEKVLKPKGYLVATCDDGKKAMDAVAEHSPDLIILDVNMPGISGLGLLKQMTDHTGKLKYRVVICTGDVRMKEFFSNMDVAGFLQKPCDAEGVLSEVWRIVGTGEPVVRPAAPVFGAGVSQPKPAVSLGRKILLADDDAANSTIVGGALRRSGFMVERTSSGADVVEKVMLTKPDMVIVKRLMAGMNGDRTAALLAELPRTSGIPVLLFEDGGDAEVGLRLEQKHKNVRGFLTDCRPDNFVSSAKRVLGL